MVNRVEKERLRNLLDFKQVAEGEALWSEHGGRVLPAFWSTIDGDAIDEDMNGFVSPFEPEAFEILVGWKNFPCNARVSVLTDGIEADGDGASVTALHSDTGASQLDGAGRFRDRERTAGKEERIRDVPLGWPGDEFRQVGNRLAIARDMEGLRGEGVMRLVVGSTKPEFGCPRIENPAAVATRGIVAARVLNELGDDPVQCCQAEVGGSGALFARLTEAAPIGVGIVRELLVGQHNQCCMLGLGVAFTGKPDRWKACQRPEIIDSGQNLVEHRPGECSCIASRDAAGPAQTRDGAFEIHVSVLFQNALRFA